MSWSTHRIVEFQHCDPAGIVFYPRYFEMISSTIEEYFRAHVGHNFAPMHFTDKRGVPTVKITVEFKQPSRLEDNLKFELTALNVGNSSVKFEMICSCEDEIRFVVQSTLVRINLDTGKSEIWPEDIRERLVAT